MGQGRAGQAPCCRRSHIAACKPSRPQSALAAGTKEGGSCAAVLGRAQSARAAPDLLCPREDGRTPARRCWAGVPQTQVVKGVGVGAWRYSWPGAAATDAPSRSVRGAAAATCWPSCARASLLQGSHLRAAGRALQSSPGEPLPLPATAPPLASQPHAGTCVGGTQPCGSQGGHSRAGTGAGRRRSRDWVLRQRL